MGTCQQTPHMRRLKYKNASLTYDSDAYTYHNRLDLKSVYMYLCGVASLWVTGSGRKFA